MAQCVQRNIQRPRVPAPSVNRDNSDLGALAILAGTIPGERSFASAVYVHIRPGLLRQVYGVQIRMLRASLIHNPQLVLAK